MAENREQKWTDIEQESSGSHTNHWLVVLVVLLFVAACLAFGYGYRQQATVSQLTSHETETNATIGQMQDQVTTLTAKLNEMTAAQAAAAAAANAPATKAAQPSAKSAVARRREDKRLKQIQTRLDDQQKQLKDTQDQVAQTRSDLEGSLSSTRDELNGSIARTHEELVALERRGERSYFEFDLTKSKQFQHAGPLMVSLRRADAKHKNFDLAMIVDDNQLSKKHVNLYEPIWIHAGDDPQPVQVVVNKIDKNHVHGYVSEPKYRQSRVAAGVAPVSATTPATNQTPVNPPNEQQPPQ